MQEQVYVIGYARVSSPKQAQTGESLEVQEGKIRAYCKEKNWELFPKDTVYKEPFTGSNTNRPKYKEIISLLKNNGRGLNIKHFVFWDFDRLTRAGTIDYDQIWADVKEYGVSLRDTTGIIQEEVDAFAHLKLKKTYGFAYGRPSEDTERLKVEDARKEKTKILRRLIEPEIRLTQEGYHIGRPDYGFENKRIYVGNKKKCIQVRYEPEAKYVEMLFKLRSEGVLTDQEICDELNARGYRSKLQNKWDKDKTGIIGAIGGNKLTVKRLQVMVERYTYAGVICEEWTNHLPIKAKYEGLVTLDVWNKANKGKVFLDLKDDGFIELQYNVGVHGHKRKRYNPQYPFRGILKCELCGKNMKASTSTGKMGNKFGAYHCERGHKRNAQPQKDAEESFNKFLDNVRFTDNFLQVFERTIQTQFRQREGELSEYTAVANTNVADLEMQKSTLIKSFPTATLPEVRKAIEEEITKLQKEIEVAKAHRDKMEIDEADVVNFIGWCKEIMEHPAKILTDIRSEQELVHTASLFFEEFPTYTQIVNGTPKLSLVFKLSEDFKVNKDQLVTH